MNTPDDPSDADGLDVELLVRLSAAWLLAAPSVEHCLRRMAEVGPTAIWRSVTRASARPRRRRWWRAAMPPCRAWAGKGSMMARDRGDDARARCVVAGRHDLWRDAAVQAWLTSRGEGGDRDSSQLTLT